MNQKNFYRKERQSAQYVKIFVKFSTKHSQHDNEKIMRVLRMTRYLLKNGKQMDPAGSNNKMKN